MKALFSTLALFVAMAVGSTANAAGLFTNFTTVTMRDTSVQVTADTALSAVNTGWCVQAVLSCKLQNLGGSGTYCPILLTSIDGAEWDSLRLDTLTAAEQNTVKTLSIWDHVATGGGGTTYLGLTADTTISTATNTQIALSRYLKVYVDEIGASTGSELWIQLFMRESR